MISIENLKDVINYVEGNSEVNEKEIDGFKYSTRRLHLVEKPERHSQFRLHTLTGVIDFLKSKIDEAIHDGKYIITIDSAKSISVGREFNETSTLAREYVLIARPFDYAPEIGQFECLDKTLISLRSQYVQNEHSKLLLAALGNIRLEENIKLDDDGFSQGITTKQGLKFASIDIPNPVRLKPFRTFVELEQPESEFVIRLDKDRENAYVKLVESDGGAWQIVAMQRIKAYLSEHLADELLNDEIVILG